MGLQAFLQGIYRENSSDMKKTKDNFNVSNSTLLYKKAFIYWKPMFPIAHVSTGWQDGYIRYNRVFFQVANHENDDDVND